MKIRPVGKFFSILAIVVFIGMIIGCEYATDVMYPTTPEIDESDSQLNIGVVLPLTGRLELSFGRHIKNVVNLAKDEINASQLAGTQLNFIIEDSKSTVDGAIAAYNKLIHETGVSVILGPATSSATKQIFPIAGENKVVAISPTSAARDLSALSEYAFRIALTTDVLVPNGVKVTHAKHNYQTVATLYDESDTFSTDADQALRETFNTLGIVVEPAETFMGGDASLKDQLGRIKATEPDAIFVSSLPTEKAIVLREAAELGITVPIILRTLTEADVEAAGEAAEGAITYVGWGSVVDTPGNQTFIENYTNEYGFPPNNYAARTYTALYVLAEAIKNAENNDANSIRDALADIRDLDTVMGKFSFDENGDAVYEPKVLIVRDGKLVLFEESE